MKKDFEIGLQFEDNTEYYASKDEYHVYLKDTTVVCDDRYSALRAHDTKEFNVFMFIKNKKNITLKPIRPRRASLRISLWALSGSVRAISTFTNLRSAVCS